MVHFGCTASSDGGSGGDGGAGDGGAGDGDEEMHLFSIEVSGVGVFEFEVEDGAALERRFTAACGRPAVPPPAVDTTAPLPMFVLADASAEQTLARFSELSGGGGGALVLDADEALTGDYRDEGETGEEEGDGAVSLAVNALGVRVLVGHDAPHGQPIQPAMPTFQDPAAAAAAVAGQELLLWAWEEIVRFGVTDSGRGGKDDSGSDDSDSNDDADDEDEDDTSDSGVNDDEEMDVFSVEVGGCEPVQRSVLTTCDKYSNHQYQDASLSIARE